MFLKRLICFFFFFLIANQTETDFFYNFIVWNTGQGSWSTYVNEDLCLHFDMGGETFEFSNVKKMCKSKLNQIFLTHLDWDHINFIAPFLKLKLKACLFYPKTHKKEWLKQIEVCHEQPSNIKIISWGDDSKKDRNASSIIYLIHNKILVTGDSPMAEEKKWYFKLPRNIDLLILGHHGSQTSTSIQLLEWTRPQMAIASARKSKYGHPHPKVLKKLLNRRIPLLKTEEHGNLYFQISEMKKKGLRL